MNNYQPASSFKEVLNPIILIAGVCEAAPHDRSGLEPEGRSGHDRNERGAPSSSWSSPTPSSSTPRYVCSYYPGIEGGLMQCFGPEKIQTLFLNKNIYLQKWCFFLFFCFFFLVILVDFSMNFPWFWLIFGNPLWNPMDAAVMGTTACSFSSLNRYRNRIHRISCKNRIWI